MTALPGWMDLPDGMRAEDYAALPEEICRRVEIVDGAVIVNVAPRRLHQDICRRLANALEAACGPGLAVSTGVDQQTAHTGSDKSPALPAALPVAVTVAQRADPDLPPEGASKL